MPGPPELPSSIEAKRVTDKNYSLYSRRSQTTQPCTIRHKPSMLQLSSNPRKKPLYMFRTDWTLQLRSCSSRPWRRSSTRCPRRQVRCASGWGPFCLGIVGPTSCPRVQPQNACARLHGLMLFWLVLERRLLDFSLRGVCVCVCAFVCVCVCLCVCICPLTFIYIYKYIYIYMYIYTHIHWYVYIFTCGEARLLGVLCDPQERPKSIAMLWCELGTRIDLTQTLSCTNMS